MKRLAAALLALAFLATPARSSWGQPVPGPVGPQASANEYAGLKPGDVAIPRSMRVYNASGSQCCWVSLTTIAHLLQLQQLYDLPRDHKAASNDREMTAVLRKRGVKFAVVHTEAEIRAAIAYKLPVAIFIPGHCCVCVGLDDSGARVLSNNHKTCEVQVWPRAQWERLYQKWGVVLYPPEGQVQEPQAFRPTSALFGGVIVQIGPRPPPVYAPPALPPAVAMPQPWYYAQPYPMYPYAPYYPRPGINIQVGPGPRHPYPNRPHYHYHQHYHRGAGGPHGGGVTLTAAAAHTIAECSVEVQQGNAGGSGTWIGYDAKSRTGLVASAAHVFKDLGPAVVTAKGMGWSRMKAKVVYLNVKTDVALLEAETDVEPVCTMLSDAEPQPGSKVYKLGYPAYAQGKLNIRTGVVKPRGGSFLFESSCYVQSGDSGGGIFLEDGSLCSVITGFYGPSGALDPRCMFGSGVEAIRTGVSRLDSQGGYDWSGKLRQKRQQRRQQRHQRKRPAAPRAPSPGSVVPTADRAVLPWNAHERHQSQRQPRSRPADENPTLPAPKWKQPAPAAPVAPPTPPVAQPPAPPPACPNPACPCPPGKCPCPPPCPCPPKAQPEVALPEPTAPVQTTTVGLGMLAFLGLKLFLLLHARRQGK